MSSVLFLEMIKGLVATPQQPFLFLVQPINCWVR